MNKNIPLRGKKLQAKQQKIESGIRDSIKVSYAEIKCFAGFAEAFQKPRTFNITVKVFGEKICDMVCQ